MPSHSPAANVPGCPATCAGAQCSNALNGFSHNGRSRRPPRSRPEPATIATRGGRVMSSTPPEAGTVRKVPERTNRRPRDEIHDPPFRILAGRLIQNRFGRIRAGRRTLAQDLLGLFNFAVDGLTRVDFAIQVIPQRQVLSRTAGTIPISPRSVSMILTIPSMRSDDDSPRCFNAVAGRPTVGWRPRRESSIS